MTASTSTTSARNKGKSTARTDTPFRDRLGDTFITVYVGQGFKRFVVHEKLICEASKFFERAIHGSFAESTSKEIHLPKDSPTIFDIFLHRIYKNELPPKMIVQQDTPDGDWVINLYRYYPMIDRFIVDPSLKTEAMDSYLEHLLRRKYVRIKINWARDLIYLVTKEDPLRKFVFDIVAHDNLLWDEGASELSEFCSMLPAEVNAEFANNLHRAARQLGPFLKKAKSPALKVQETIPAVFGVRIGGSIAEVERYQVGYLKQQQQ